MADRIVIASQKGGSGKTTTAMNLAVCLAERHRRTLLVDLDPQGGIGASLAKQDRAWRGLTELLMGVVTPQEAILQTHQRSLSILPRGRLDPMDICDFEQALFAEGVLDKVLSCFDDKFQFMIVDTPSGLGMVTRAALRACEFALIPFQAEPMALRSIGQVLRVIEGVQRSDNPRLRLLGILPTMVSLQTGHSMNVMAEMWSGFECVLATTIPRAEVFADASQRGLPVSYMGGKPSPESRRYDELAVEVERLVIQLKGAGDDGEDRPERSVF